ncbi:MAG: hypothetical protein AAGF02_04285, partial [Actinomycetota bacterium]
MPTIEQTAPAPNGNGEVYIPQQPGKPEDPLQAEADLEIVKVGELRACLSAALVDDGVTPTRVINVANGAEVQAKVDLIGELWRCACGSVRFTADFSGGGDAPDFVLRDTVPFDGAASREVSTTIAVSQADFGIDDDVADYRVSVTALLLDTTGRPLAM